MDTLNIGDKLYNVEQNGFNDFARYSFSEVVRLTETLAVLKNGVRLINRPKQSYIIEDVGYSVNRNKGSHWHIVSLKAIRNAQIENEKIRIHDWFEEKQFTLKEKQHIYKMFKTDEDQ
ncbi:pyruvate kinase [Maribacter sp. 1_MG-2023]|uniref:pyruvate kinase n=1 Tax=Maribacter sp. 1_MG-2023 TaxID=3062677 RepID=UPI0026E12F10|nr:pyruvate kinase [Maribacter sp. 1_MG-2023]MDO6471497.1 pyruvate kinase [Maribacter sp. 1_MG-2023]